MKIEISNRIFGIGTNPGGGAYAKATAETIAEHKALGGRDDKVNKRLVSNPTGRCPSDGGLNPYYDSHIKFWGSFPSPTAKEKEDYAVFLEKVDAEAKERMRLYDLIYTEEYEERKARLVSEGYALLAADAGKSTESTG